MTIRFQNFKEMSFFPGGQLLLEVTESMHKDVDRWRVAREFMKCLSKALPVELQYSAHYLSVGIGDNPSQFPHLALAVSHQEQLVGSLKAHKIMHRCGLLERAKTSERKDSCQKMLADVQILESAFVFYGQVAKLFQHGAAEGTRRFAEGCTLFGTGINLNVRDTARWRPVFQDEAVHIIQTIKEPATEFPHFVGKVQAGGRLDHFETVSRGHDPRGRAGSP